MHMSHGSEASLPFTLMLSDEPPLITSSIITKNLSHILFYISDYNDYIKSSNGLRNLINLKNSSSTSELKFYTSSLKVCHFNECSNASLGAIMVSQLIHVTSIDTRRSSLYGGYGRSASKSILIGLTNCSIILFLSNSNCSDFYF